MTASTTMTIRLDPQLKAKLGKLADGTRRSRSFLAAEAVETYVDRELAIIEGIERGLADVEAGRTVSHEDAMASLRQVIDAAADNSLPGTAIFRPHIEPHLRVGSKNGLTAGRSSNMPTPSLSFQTALCRSVKGIPRSTVW